MTQKALHIRNLSFAYPDGDEILHDISLDIDQGEKVALMGLNGAGKSTLLLHIAGLLHAPSGSIEVEGIPLNRKNLPMIRRRVGMLFQNSDDQLFMPTVGEDVAFGVRNMGIADGEVERRTVQALRAVDCEALRHRAPYTLSGGEKRRVALATVLAMQVSVLVMDEPSAGLDPRARHQTIELLRRLQHTQLIATHDIDLAARICQRIVILGCGRIVADGSTARILSDHRLLVRCGLEAPELLPTP